MKKNNKKSFVELLSEVKNKVDAFVNAWTTESNQMCEYLKDKLNKEISFDNHTIMVMERTGLCYDIIIDGIVCWNTRWNTNTAYISRVEKLVRDGKFEEALDEMRTSIIYLEIVKAFNKHMKEVLAKEAEKTDKVLREISSLKF